MATFYPLLGKYYKELNFSGTEIGVLFSAATFTTMLMQPVWGIICDKKERSKDSLLIMQGAIIFIALIFPFVRSYWILFSIIILHFVFQCGLFPILDTIIYKDVYNFGKIRLWGSLGFASMALFSGKISEIIGINNMFFIYSFSMCLAFAVTFYIKEVETETTHKKKKISIKKHKRIVQNKLHSFYNQRFLYIRCIHGR